jgi:hypothetical protein
MQRSVLFSRAAMCRQFVEPTTGVAHGIDENRARFGSHRAHRSGLLALPLDDLTASIGTVSWLMSIPRSASKSSTLRSDSGHLTYIITTRRMTSGELLKYRNGLLMA